MKKITAAMLAAILIICASGCNNGNQPSQTSDTAAQTSATSKNVSRIALDADENDTTQEALDYLGMMVPKFAKYLEKRRSIPLTIETTIEKDDKYWISNIYIKDETHMVLYNRDPDGNETRAIYAGSMAYQIETATKTMYAQEVGEEAIRLSVKQYRLIMNYSDVLAATYGTGTGKVEGVEYNCEAIQSKSTDEDGNETVNSSSVYYFDKDTDELVYMDTNSTITKIDKLENSFDRDDLFEIPTDYETFTVDEMIERYYATAQTGESEAAESGS